MKYFLFFVGLIVLLFLILLGVTTPTVKSLSNCLTDYNSTIGNDISVARQIKWNKELFCRNGKTSIASLQSCYDSVRTKSILPIDLVLMTAKIIHPNSGAGDIKKIIMLHNSSCSDYPEMQVQ